MKINGLNYLKDASRKRNMRTGMNEAAYYADTSNYCSRVSSRPANCAADCHPSVLGRFAPLNMRLQQTPTSASKLPRGNDGKTLLADGLRDPNADSDLGRIVYAFRQWRGEPAPDLWIEGERLMGVVRERLGGLGDDV